MNRLSCAVVAGLWSLLGACEKPTPFEITTPAGKGNPTPVPSMDASLPALDATTPVQADTGPEAPVGVFTQAGLLTAIGDCALDRSRSFVVVATALRDAARAHADSLAPEALAGAQQAWRAAMAPWQELELFRFGPAGSSLDPGGKDLRNNIYFYPDLNDCQVDLSLVSRAYAMGAEVLAVSAKGLGALEYLLFYAGSANSCGAGTTINTAASGGGPTPWQQLDAGELARRRADYAVAVAEDVLAQANAIAAAWDPAQASFYAQFTTAGAGSQLFPRAIDAFNVVGNAMFYLDTELKDFKVAIPAGISPVCEPEICPEAVESRWSGASNANIRGNLSGFRLLFNGCGANYAGLGFDDWLRTIGHAELAERMTTALIAADQAAAALPLPLAQMLTANLAQVHALHAAIKAVSDPFKTEFLSALNLERPKAAEGDND